jgi:hypothetical protein
LVASHTEDRANLDVIWSPGRSKLGGTAPVPRRAAVSLLQQLDVIPWQLHTQGRLSMDNQFIVSRRPSEILAVLELHYHRYRPPEKPPVCPVSL